MPRPAVDEQEGHSARGGAFGDGEGEDRGEYGPTQGVQPKAKAMPINVAPRRPGLKAESGKAFLVIEPLDGQKLHGVQPKRTTSAPAILRNSSMWEESGCPGPRRRPPAP